MANSLLGAIDVYNLLPRYVVAAGDVKSFQNRLQQLLKEAARNNMVDWTTFLSNRHLMFMHPLRQFTEFEGITTSGTNDECGVETTDDHQCINGWLQFAQ